MSTDQSSNLNIAIRVDASHDIGVGHFMRCLTLADALRSRGARVRFVCRHLPGHLRDLVASNGHELRMMDESAKTEAIDELSQSRLLGTSQRHDAAETLGLLSDARWDWIVVDHYGIDARWESVVRSVTKKLMVIDDTADRMHDCDLLLDQNLYSNMDTRYVGKVPAGCKTLLGPRFALLRDEFRKWRTKTRPRTGPVKRVLVFIGGMDANNYMGSAIDALVKIGDRALGVDVVIGPQHTHREQIETTCSENQFVCHVHSNRMAELMAAADLGIGAGGSASWERCCLGLPSVVVSLASNQIEIASALDTVGACQYIGSIGAANSAVMHRAILEMLRSRDRLQTMSTKAFALVDGLGADRLCEAMGF